MVGGRSVLMEWGGLEVRGEYIGPMFSAMIAGLSRHIPSQCAVCRSWPRQALCDACVTRFAQPQPRCGTCALPVPHDLQLCSACLTTPSGLDAALAAVPYAYPWSGLVVDFKFHGQVAWARAFATLLRSTPWVEPALEAADILLPMPLSAQRLAERGFNQTLLLARSLCPDKIRTDLLLRIQDTPPQRTLPRKERLQSVQHAFAVDPLQLAALAGKRVVLIDDVMTSGASLAAAAATVRQAGAGHVTGLVFARTES